MEVQISYCNSIDSATISLAERKLNIRFALMEQGKVPLLGRCSSVCLDRKRA